MSPICRTLVLLGLSLSLLPLPGLAAPIKNPLQNVFYSANDSYRRGDFQKARALYEMVVAAKPNDPVALYNLGNACYRMQEFHYAILYYERSLRLDPSARQVRDNLKLARLNILDKDDSISNPFIGIWQGLIMLLSLNWWLLIGVICLTLFFLSIVLPVYIKKKKFNETMKKASPFIIGLLLLVAIITFSSVRRAERSDRAVIMSEEVFVLGSPTDDAKQVFPIHRGTTIMLLSEDKGWANISVNPKLNGWIRTDTYTKI